MTKLFHLQGFVACDGREISKYLPYFGVEKRQFALRCSNSYEDYSLRFRELLLTVCALRDCFISSHEYRRMRLNLFCELSGRIIAQLRKRETESPNAALLPKIWVPRVLICDGRDDVKSSYCRTV